MATKAALERDRLFYILPGMEPKLKQVTFLSLTPEDRAALAAEMARESYALQTSPVLTTEQAMKMVGKGTDYGFRVWLGRYGRRAGCGQGRYSKEKILQGLRMEEKTGSKYRSGKNLKRKDAGMSHS